jgi:hypothetical protein
MEGVDHTAATEGLSEDRGAWSEVRDDLLFTGVRGREILRTSPKRSSHSVLR